MQPCEYIYDFSSIQVNLKVCLLMIYIYIHFRLNIGTELFADWLFFVELEKPKVWMSNEVSNSFNMSALALSLKYVANFYV